MGPLELPADRVAVRLDVLHGETGDDGDRVTGLAEHAVEGREGEHAERRLLHPLAAEPDEPAVRDPEGALADDVGALTEADGLRLARVPSVTQLRPEPERARHPLADDGGRDVHPRARHGLRVAEAHVEADDHLHLLPRHADRPACPGARLLARASRSPHHGPRGPRPGGRQKPQ